MTTQYTSILKLALPVQGELSGTWGDVVNDNITSMVEEAIAGRAVINTWTTNSHTLTSANGTTSESRCAMLEFTDTGTALSGDATVICPTAAKIYICKNDAGQKVTIKTSAGTGVAIADGQTMFVFCDGTNVVEAVTSMSSLKLGTVATSVQVTAILDEDNMASDSATSLATQQSIKAYVDSQVTAQDLDFGGDSGTGSVDLDSQTFTIAGTANEIETSASGQTLTVGLPAAVTVTTSVTTPTVQVTDVKANDGTAAVSIANTTGQTTITDAVLTTADINAGTIDNTTIGATTASTGAFTTITSSGNTTVSGSLVTDTIAEETATAGVTVDGVLLKDGGATLTGDLIVDTDTLYVDSANNNVGIGESSPVNIANYVGLTFSDTTGGFIRFKNDAGTQGAQITGSGSNLSIETIPALPIIFYTNSTEAMRIDSSGNVLVGTTSGTNFVDKMRVVGDTNGVDFGGSSSTGVVRVRGSDTGAALIDFTKLSVNPNSSPFYNGRIFYSFNDHFMRFETNAQEAMRIDSSGNVGIGVTNPSDFNGGANNLVVGTGSGSQGISIYAGTSSNSSVFFVDGDSGTAEYRGQINYRHDVDAMSFHTAGGFERMRIDSNGSIGIGTTLPLSNGGAGAKVVHIHNPTVAQWAINHYTNGTTGANSANGFIVGQIGADASLFLYENATMQFGTNSSERMRIDNSGSLLINRTSKVASELLSVKGEIRAGYTASDNQVYLGVDSSNAYLGTNASGFGLKFETGGSERMRIDSSGNVGIGTTSPSTLLDVQGSSGIIGRFQTSSGDLQVNMVTPNANDAIIAFGDASTYRASITVNTSDAITFQTSSSLTERMRIDSSGRVLIGTSTSFADANSDDLQISGSGDTGMIIKSGTSNYGSIYFGDGTSGDARNEGILRYYHSDNQMQIWTSAQERLRINSSGHATLLNPTSTNSRYFGITNSSGSTGWTFGNGVTSAAHKFEIYDNTNGATRLLIHPTGEVRHAANPAFLMYTTSTTTTTSSGAWANITMNNEAYDVGGNFSSNTFTAPVTGKYQMNVQLLVSAIDTAANYYVIDCSTSNRNYHYLFYPTNILSADTSFQFIWSFVADMDQGDTAFLRINQNGGTLNQTTVVADPNYTRWTGYMMG